MSEPDLLVSGDTGDATELIAGLRRAGAEQFDPVRFHYLESLARRLAVQQENVQRVLRARLSEAAANFTERMALTHGAAEKPLVEATPKQTALAGLTAYIAQQAQTSASGTPEDGLLSPAGSAPELKSIREFRSTWSKLSVDKQVTQAIDQAPDNAGPLNSHMLVLRSLATMREISPDYLNRFMSYVDTLLCLDHADKLGKPVAKKPRAVKATKK